MENDKLVRLSDVERWILTETASLDTPADRDAVVERMRCSIPAVDAVEVRHGRWIDDFIDCICSVCNERVDGEIVFMIDDDDMPRYCPNCGARMDGEEEHNAAD